MGCIQDGEGLNSATGCMDGVETQIAGRGQISQLLDLVLRFLSNGFNDVLVRARVQRRAICRRRLGGAETLGAIACGILRNERRNS